VEGRLVVTQLGPQGTNGLQRADVIEQINGVSAETVLLQREQVISGATPQWRRYRSVNELHFDSAGTAITLRVRPASGGAAREVQLRYAYPRVVEPLPDKIAELKPGIFYVDIGRISDADFNTALPKLQQARGIVFDMRGYPYQVSTPAILARLASDTIRSAYFEAPTFRRPDRASAKWRNGGWVVPPMQPHLGARIAFLTGGGAISYAESTMGIVESYHLGEIVGETTAGTNGNINIFPATGGYQVVFTGMRVRKRDDSPHHGVGIKPTIPTARTLKGVAEGRDEALERAITVVESVRADRQ
jgi:C-terminal processing protease CtpA/Prc